MPNDYGYFGKGSTGYAQYKTAFDRNFGKGGGGNNSGGNGCGTGCATVIIGLVSAVVLICSIFVF